MKITIISHNYFPEDSGIGLYSTGMAEFLASKHDVTILTGVPYYPQWKIHSNYIDNPLFSKEKINKVTVHRFKQYTPAKPNFFKRVLQMIHFFLGTLYTGLKSNKADLIIVVMPFTLSIVAGWFIKHFKGGKLWVHIQDFEFEAAIKTSTSTKNSVAFETLFKIEKWILLRADFSSTISKAMILKLAKKRKGNQVYFPNWIDYSLINPETAHKNILFNPKTFNILYSGNIGEKQDWEFYIDFVTAMQVHPEFHFYLVGDGAKREVVVMQLVGKLNFSYYSPVSYKDLNDLLCGADVHVLFQKPEFKDLVMPSKILGMMASAKPSIITGHEDSEIKVNFEHSQGGYFFQENTIESIKKCLMDLKNNPDEACLRGIKARKFVIEYFSYEKVLLEFQLKIEQSVQNK